MFRSSRPRQDMQVRDNFDKHMRLLDDCPTLPCARISKAIYLAVSEDSLCNHQDQSSISLENYARPFKLLVSAEFAYSEMALRKHDRILDVSLQKISLLATQAPSYNIVVIPNISKSDPNLIPNDLIVATQGGRHNICTIIEVSQNSVMFAVDKGRGTRQRIYEPIEEGKYYIRFAMSGHLLDRTLAAIDEFSLMKLESIFNSPQDHAQTADAKIDLTFGSGLPDSRLDKLNDSQRRAVKHILAARCRPRPYILFGPPGTGKTATIVELVVQIYHRRPQDRILILAGSNTCVDKLADDLDKTNQIHDLIRLSSKSHLDNLGASNIFEYTGDVERAEASRVCVTTNFMSGSISSQYDWIMIDEAGHNTEPDSLIPMNRCRSGGCIVLAGDPKQLGPVVKCRQAESLGLGRSLLVRLTESVDVYKRDTVDGYDERYITQLNISYRCDPRVMTPWNQLFYNGSLEGRGRTPPSLLHLMKVKKPSLVKLVNFGEEAKFANSTSFYNELEAQHCAALIISLYAMGFEPHQIGVITPYKSQVGKIRRSLREEIDKAEKVLNDLFAKPAKPAPPKSPTPAPKQENGLNAQVKSITLDIDDLELSESFSDDLNVDPFSDSDLEAEEKEMMQKDRLAKRERKKLKEADEQRYEAVKWNSCKVDTVDGFQGNEREIILVSLVRTSGVTGQLRFIEDDRRFNVTLSRAKWMNIVIGNERTFRASFRKWADFYEKAEKI